MFKFLKGVIFFAPFFLLLPLTSHSYTTHLFCECVYTYPEDPAGPIELCPVDADVDVYVDAEIGFFQFGKNDTWDPISVSEDLMIVEAFTQDGDFTQRITASLNRFNGKLLVRYDGYFEGYGNSIFSDLHYCSLTPGQQQF